jgi:hypothetical protein
MLTHTASPPRGHWRSLTNTQGLPRHRLPLMPAQHVSRQVPSRHFHIGGERTHDTDGTHRMCGFCWPRLGGCQTGGMPPGGWRCKTRVLPAGAHARGYRRVSHNTAYAVAWPIRGDLPRTEQRSAGLRPTQGRFSGPLPDPSADSGALARGLPPQAGQRRPQRRRTAARTAAHPPGYAAATQAAPPYHARPRTTRRPSSARGRGASADDAPPHQDAAQLFPAGATLVSG